MTGRPAAAPAQQPAATGDTPAATALAAAQRVLRLESEAVAALGHSLGDEFAQAIDILFTVKGRVVVSGIGKSGHVARKIAATMASTGTPSLFVHPAEASHGDLGMITKGDAVVVLSNSGETTELADIVTHCRRFGIPLVAMVGRRESTLARNADLALILPSAPEACPLGLAPTTSTTMMLALGDALAVALLDRRGFNSDRFQELHPGGKLGRKLVKVSDVHHTGDALPLVAPTTRMSDALLEMSRKSFGCVGVVDEAGVLVGIITDGDLRRHMDRGLLDRTAGEVMTRRPTTIAGSALASEALGRMTAANGGKGITSLFVADQGRPVGILNVHDCLRAGVDADDGDPE